MSEEEQGYSAQKIQELQLRQDERYSELNDLNLQYVKMLFTVNGGGTAVVLSLIAQLYATGQHGLASEMALPAKIFSSGIIATIIFTALRIIRHSLMIGIMSKPPYNAKGFVWVFHFITINIFAFYCWGFIAIIWAVISASRIMTAII